MGLGGHPEPLGSPHGFRGYLEARLMSWNGFSAVLLGAVLGRIRSLRGRRRPSTVYLDMAKLLHDPEREVP
jgi:hypothetical protein